MFNGWNGADVLIAHKEKIPPCDFYASSFDLPHRCGTTLETIPAQTPYLPLLPPDEVTRLDSGGLPKIGVVWGGSPLHSNDAKRSVPLKIIAEIFTLPHLKFYSFNRDLKPGDAEILPSYPVENLVPRLTDFGAAARLIGQMDVVITCDTATAHLAGGLGKQVWVMLPFAPDWRWLTERSDSPWYPTARLFRQPRSGDWQSVVTAVKELLGSLKREPFPPRCLIIRSKLNYVPLAEHILEHRTGLNQMPVAIDNQHRPILVELIGDDWNDVTFSKHPNFMA